LPAANHSSSGTSNAWRLRGFSDIVINHAHLGEKLEAALGDGRKWGVNIQWSPEPPGALETAGGIAKALPLLGNAAFLVVNGDIWCDWDFRRAHALTHHQAHLVMMEQSDAIMPAETSALMVSN
jgi:MurNAc alpha-1-phosphate uridylyltransferase